MGDVGSSKQALEIAEEILATTGRALMSRDFESFASVFQLPHHTITFEDHVVLETSAELERSFINNCDHYAGLGVTDLVRWCVAAEFENDTRITSTHVAHLMRHGTRLNEPYPVMSTIELVDGTWKIAKAQYALDAKDSKARALTKGFGAHGTET